ncbi:MAG: hypothetical protein ACTSSE_19205 [Candidatus Thorarchaeota archaeon]
MIARTITGFINKLVVDANADAYQCFLTTKTNFRDDLVADYKANRSDTERPVNLAWAKRWAVDNLESNFHPKMEADDLLGIHMTEDSVLWSLDKDLRQIPGKHLDDATRQVVTVTEYGTLKDLGKKAYFDGMIGFYYQLLIGDGTDWIVGCGERLPAPKTKMGTKRKGIGHKAACQIILKAAMTDVNNIEPVRNAVYAEYQKLHGKYWKHFIEVQAQLLWMVREQKGEHIKMWTYDDRDAWFDLGTGLFLHG